VRWGIDQFQNRDSCLTFVSDTSVTCTGSELGTRSYSQMYILSNKDVCCNVIKRHHASSC